MASSGRLSVGNRLAKCSICGALVPIRNMEDHILGDEAVLRIIGHNNPEWARQECLDYYIRNYRPGATSRL